MVNLLMLLASDDNDNALNYPGKNDRCNSEYKCENRKRDKSAGNRVAKWQVTTNNISCHFTKYAKGTRVPALNIHKWNEPTAYK